MKEYKLAEDLALGLFLAKWDEWNYVEIIKHLKQGVVLDGIIIYNNQHPNLVYLAECIVQANYDLVSMFERGINYAQDNMKENMLSISELRGLPCTA